ncbi:type I restriction-modification system subunit M [Candidatus Oleimmundimicrobium sp.]|uniref:class I SAM-dependent DNA methyltransferase n=1 Tax=Candidatus Oleimmundimicrobium sp. TaxID=3060597 RepID=UPI0027253D37|nr:type I restriction-modification system subunit M [Candidatus Oleimmundimicrobium sp.]MDO8885971.1 type I restriction-modification system subunit M [Candidatus Oleimmundimicrobium sp.]
MIPKWLDKRYKILWEAYKTSDFRFEDAANILKEKIEESEDQVNVILSELRKRGWLKASFDPTDARKRIYKLKGKEEFITETLSIKTNKLTRGDLEGLLKKAADLIRTRVDYTFILVLLFYKRISDKWELEFGQARKEALEDGLTEEEAKEEAKNSIYHDFDLPDEFLWENIRKEPARLPENFSKAMKALAERNPELRDVFENVDFVQFTTNRENAEILRQLVELFSARTLQHVSPDILGDAYEWILSYFAPQKAKEGEVYTAREVIKLIVEILDPKADESVYDPACGSGGMLISAYQHVEDEQGNGDADKLFLFGQEANHKTLALAKMNLYIHDIRNAQVTLGDTLLYPKFKEGEDFKKFNVVIANPPWNQDGYPEETLKKGEFWRERYRLGFTPKQSADWAWIQHMVSSTKDDTGRVGVVIDNGSLFRGGKEKAIRMAALNADYIEALILLPEKLFYNTGAPGAVMILNKNKPTDRKEKILFINASNEYEQHPDVRKLNRLGDKHIKNIVEAYREFSDGDGFSRVVSLEEIKENDYNLNVTLYVFPEEEIEEIDVDKEWDELKILEGELAEVENKIEGYLEELKGSNDV